ncbi:uncharacterized protein BT62DRAFT_1075194 [Guyanagaster necrorhizus]|uniref:Uncharacterized protein n=1 Tax=Guyanagaster necrorhizus TaxID=856835 RepID=A0A9P7VWL0_9AGAR|nr:uncharacterized protein BT62DRAFT_1075194 [Guyanagaster necrorhizus MCA 3950]KAG7447882.1 hypothetical protein BT62DRAFT_1075194 [Guyanagaster necrorhizus MCA 3950]
MTIKIIFRLAHVKEVRLRVDVAAGNSLSNDPATIEASTPHGEHEPRIWADAVKDGRMKAGPSDQNAPSKAKNSAFPAPQKGELIPPVRDACVPECFYVEPSIASLFGTTERSDTNFSVKPMFPREQGIIDCGLSIASTEAVCMLGCPHMMGYLNKGRISQAAPHVKEI